MFALLYVKAGFFALFFFSYYFCESNYGFMSFYVARYNIGLYEPIILSSSCFISG